jgi:hypothetical protein
LIKIISIAPDFSFRDVLFIVYFGTLSRHQVFDMLSAATERNSRMIRLLLILAPLALALGCQRKPELTQPNNEEKAQEAVVPKNEPRAQVKIGEDDQKDWRRVPFDILKVYRNQKLTDNVPWHVDGGDWTFFDCRTAPPDPATFTVGVRTKPEGGGSIAWGEGIIQVSDRADGVKLIDCISNSFKHKTPPERKQQPLEPWKFNTAVLGQGGKADSQGGIGGQGGNWSATKWFLERDGYSAEVFFNYNLKELKGEFNEKDPNHREDLLVILSIVVRDGPRPERTPQTDPNLTDVGPKFGDGKRIAGSARHFRFSPDSKLIFFSDKADDGSTVLFAVSADQLNKPKELARVQQDLESFTVLDTDATRIVVVEAIPKVTGELSLADPKRIWWVDRRKKELRELRGGWDTASFHIEEKLRSPDGQFVVFSSSRRRTDLSQGNYSVIHILKCQTGGIRTIELSNQTPDPIGWVGSGKDLRIAFLKNHRWERDKKQEWFLGEPETGKFEPVEKSPLPSDEWTSRQSPDQNLVASIEKKSELIITDLKTGKNQSLTFHEDDRRFVHEDGGFQWVSPRYLLLHLNRMVFLDVKTMKMSYPLPKKDESHGHIFSPDFKWVLWQKANEGLYLSPVITPPEGPESSRSPASKP